mmetsp:Transcript_11877/g.50900  ORF Transcript_11877/g.50900 Transcript_11877/m.50900 type:complete len:520 (-) Transcript_11877:527-2086(-)
MHPLAFRLSASKSTPENKGCGASAKKPTNGNESATNEGATAASPRARAAATAASNFSHRARTCVSQKCPAVSHVYATSSGTPSDVARRSTTARSSRRRCSIALTRPCREKSRSVSRSRSPCPRRSRYRAGTSRCMSFWNRSLSAALECVMSSVRCPGSLWYRQCMICVAVSVLPVPGGPTTIVSPGCTPLAIAETCVGVNRTAFKTGWSSGYGPGSGGTYDSTRRIRFETEPRSSSLFAACKSFSAFSSSAPSFSSSFVSNATVPVAEIPKTSSSRPSYVVCVHRGVTMSTSRSISTSMSICGAPSFPCEKAEDAEETRARGALERLFGFRHRRRHRREDDTSQYSRGPMGRPPKSMPQSAREPEKGEEEEASEDSSEEEASEAEDSSVSSEDSASSSSASAAKAADMRFSSSRFSRSPFPRRPASRGHSSRARASSAACSRLSLSMISATSFDAAPFPCTIGTSPTRLCSSCSAFATSYSDETSLSTAKSRHARLHSTSAASRSKGTRDIGSVFRFRN